MAYARPMLGLCSHQYRPILMFFIVIYLDYQPLIKNIDGHTWFFIRESKKWLQRRSSEGAVVCRRMAIERKPLRGILHPLIFRLLSAAPDGARMVVVGGGDNDLLRHTENADLTFFSV